MINADQREIAENLFKPARKEIKDATSLEEERRAALVKNLNRLKALRLSRDKASLAKTSGVDLYDGFAAMWVGSEADPTTGLRGKRR
jgi:hypothetical protein